MAGDFSWHAGNYLMGVIYNWLTLCLAVQPEQVGEDRPWPQALKECTGEVHLAIE